MSTVRRIYFYSVSLVTLGLGAWGLGLLIRLVLDLVVGREPSVFRAPGYYQNQLALGIGIVLVSGFVWALHWRVAQRHAGSEPAEAAAALRKLYTTIVLTASAIVALMTGAGVMGWALGGFRESEFGSGSLAAAVVAAGLWLYHRRVEVNDGTPVAAGRTLQRWGWYIVSAWSLFMLGNGIIGALSGVLESAGLWGPEFAGGGLWTPDLRTRVAYVVLGLPWWAFHWFKAARGDQGSSLRQVYLYLFAILGGALNTLISSGVMLYRLLTYVFGVALPAGAAYFRFLSWTIPALVVGAVLWTYHWQRVKEEASGAEERRSSAHRVYYYLISGLGLGALAAGIVILLGLLLDLLLAAIDPSYVVVSTAGWWRDPLALFIDLTLMGSVIWLYYWLAIQKESLGKVKERAARSRRVYLYTVLCLGIIAVVAGMINVVYRVLAGFLQSTNWFSVLQDLKWGLQAILVAGPTLLYHWGVLREDQRAGGEQAVAQKTVVAVLDERTATALVPRLESALGAKVRLMSLSGEAAPVAAVSPPTDEEVNALAQAILASPHQKLVIVARDGGLGVFTYKDS